MKMSQSEFIRRLHQAKKAIAEDDCLGCALGSVGLDESMHFQQMNAHSIFNRQGSAVKIINASIKALRLPKN